MDIFLLSFSFIDWFENLFNQPSLGEVPYTEICTQIAFIDTFSKPASTVPE